MIIAIDGYEANTPNRVGIGRYAFEIIKNIYRINIERKTHNPASPAGRSELIFRIYLPDKPLGDMPKETAWWSYRVLRPKKFWTFGSLPFALYSDTPKAHIVFSPTHYIPRFTDIPRVMSIMDLSYLRYPELFRKKDLHQLIHWTNYSAKHAAKIFTISKYSKNDIITEYGVTAEKVVVTYPGLTMINNSKFKSPFEKTQDRQSSKVLEKYKISKKYILSVGTLQPRKNYVRLIEAFSKLNKEYSDTELVIVGKKGWLFEEILSAPLKFGVTERVKFLDFVAENDLPYLYKNANSVVLVSLYEGFGLPVLEAMALGTQVVVSNVSSLPEVAGSAGIYVNPMDLVSIVNGLKTALSEYGTKTWRDRILLGKELSKKFTWDKAAKETLKVLMEVGRSKS